MKFFVALLVVTCFCSSLFSQEIKYTDVDDSFLSEGTAQFNERSTKFYFGSFYNYALNTFVNMYKDNKLTKQAKDEAAAKISVLTNNYRSIEKYPSEIVEGWHSVIATDNALFCKEAKVFIKDNKVKEFVIDNCIKMKFNSTGTIKNAKTVVMLNNFNGEQLELLELYFIYDIDEPAIVAPPIQAGYVCFWTDKNSYGQCKVRVNGQMIEEFTMRFKKEPDCFETGMVCLVLKPGTYPVVVERYGGDDDLKIEVKPGMCLKFKVKHTSGHN